jgi:hypothetical protein
VSHVRERGRRSLFGRIFHVSKGSEPRRTEHAGSAGNRATDQRTSALVQSQIAERRDDPDGCCAELTQSVAALRETSSRDDLKDRLPLLAAIWAGAEGLAWVKRTEDDRTGGFDFVVGHGTADSFLAWMLFFACFGGIDEDLYRPGLRLFREEVVGEVEDPYDVAAVHSYLDEIADAYGMHLGDGSL